MLWGHCKVSTGSCCHICLRFMAQMGSCSWTRASATSPSKRLIDLTAWLLLMSDEQSISGASIWRRSLQRTALLSGWKRDEEKEDCCRVAEGLQTVKWSSFGLQFVSLFFKLFLPCLFLRTSSEMHREPPEKVMILQLKIHRYHKKKSWFHSCDFGINNQEFGPTKFQQKPCDSTCHS